MTVAHVDPVTGEIIDVPVLLTAPQARALTDHIRGSLAVAYDGLVEAWRGRADLALGYPSWDAYCAGEFAEGRMVRLDREQRREIVATMRQAGMSARAIESATGIDHVTVSRDARAKTPVADETPAATTTGLDGKTYSPRPSSPRPVPSPPPGPASDRPRCTESPADLQPGGGEPRSSGPQRRPLRDAFFDAAYDLNKTVDRLTRLVTDDRFPRNAEQVAARHRSDLLRAAEALAGVLDRLNP